MKKRIMLKVLATMFLLLSIIAMYRSAGLSMALVVLIMLNTPLFYTMWNREIIKRRWLRSPIKMK